MGGNRQKKSSLSIFSFFSKRSRKGQDNYTCDDSMKAYKVWPSDEDRVHWVADPSIDRKAAAYIDKYHAETQKADQQHHSF